MRADESKREIEIIIRWSSKGISNYGLVRRKLPSIIENISSVFHKIPLANIKGNTRADQFDVSGTIKSMELLSKIDEVSDVLSNTFKKNLVF